MLSTIHTFKSYVPIETFCALEVKEALQYAFTTRTTPSQTVSGRSKCTENLAPVL